MTPTATEPRPLDVLAELKGPKRRHSAWQAMLAATPTVELWLELGRRLAADETDIELTAVLTVAEQMLTAVRAIR